MINLIKIIKEKIDLRVQKQKTKEQDLKDAAKRISEIESLIQDKQEEYNISLDDSLLEEITALKIEVEGLKAKQQILSSTGLLSSNFIYSITHEEIEQAVKDIDEKFNNLKFDKLKSDIEKARTNYIKSLESYQAAAETFHEERREIANIRQSLDPELLKAVHVYFVKASAELQLDEKFKVGNYRYVQHNIEEALYESINKKADDISFTGGWEFKG
ncbi:MAG: hypothetical protein ABRQ25_08980 [Clostridiaceae bacterium]